MKKIIIDNRVYIPKKYIDPVDLKHFFVRKLYTESTCSQCPYKKERFCDQCNQCPAFLGKVKLYNESEDYYGIPVGEIPYLNKKLGISLKDFREKGLVKDTRAKPPFKHAVKFTGNLYHGQTIDGDKKADQEYIVGEWLKYKNGIIQAMPRTGKSILGIYLACKLGYRTLIVSHQEELLKQFRKYLTQVTNIKEVEKKVGHRIAGIARTPEDLKNFDIACITYQSYISDKGKDRIKKYLYGKFGTLIVDECHLLAASAFSKFAIELNPRHRIGLTATPKRKDGMEFILYSIMGYIKATSTSTALVPTIKVIKTGVESKYSYRNWMNCMKFLCSNFDRNKQIVKLVFKLLREGRSILIATDFRDHVNKLVELINSQAKINNYKRNEHWPLQLAAPFMQGVNRARTLKESSNGNIRVIVAIRGMVKHGLDNRAWDTVLSTIPTNNPALFYQLSCRCCTPPEKGVIKNNPEVYVFLDGVGQSSGCLRSLYNKEIRPGMSGKHPRYKIDKESKVIIESIEPFWKQYKRY
jgi:superfamily II DNA or RNA helicase